MDSMNGVDLSAAMIGGDGTSGSELLRTFCSCYHDILWLE